MKITHLRLYDIPYKEAGFYAKRATGKLDGRDFEARQYQDHRGGPRGAAPVRWRAWFVGMTKGQQIAIARQLNVALK